MKQPYAMIKGYKKSHTNIEWTGKTKQWKNRHGSNCINTLTLWPWAHDWYNLIERKVKKKAQIPILKQINIEGWNWKSIRIHDFATRFIH